MSALRRADVSGRAQPIDDDPLVGRWRNADDHAAVPALAEVELIREGARAVAVRMRGLDGFDWGQAPIDALFAGSPGASLAAGFTASFARDRNSDSDDAAGPCRARVQANIKLGVLVVAAFMHLPGRPPTFTRDFMYRVDDGGPA